MSQPTRTTKQKFSMSPMKPMPSIARFARINFRRRFLFPSVRKGKFYVLKEGCRNAQLGLLILFAYAWVSHYPLEKASSGHLLEVNSHQISMNPADASLFLESPLNTTRPRYQFVTYDVLNRSPLPSDSRGAGSHIFSIFTFTSEPSVKLLDTAYAILNQSLRSFQWIIIHSCRIGRPCADVLRTVENLDKRILAIETSMKMDFEGRYKSALSVLRARPSRFFTFLQEGDVFELTTLEKCAWLFSSNRHISYATTYVRGLSTDKVEWKYGFHNGLNPLSFGDVDVSFWIVGKTKALLRNRCILLNEHLSVNGSIRKCLQNSTDCGITIPEVLRWSQQNISKLTLNTEKLAISGVLGINRKYHSSALTGKGEKTCSYHDEPGLAAKNDIIVDAPFKNKLDTSRGILFLIPWMDIGGADIANLNLLQEFSKRGYRVTVVCTLMELHGTSRAFESLFLRFSHDLFTIPSIIRTVDAPRFLSYIIRSRNVELVFLSNTDLGYSLLPYLTQTHKSVKFVDYVHNEQPNWRNGGYPLMSSKGQQYLDMTFASSMSAIRFMEKTGKNRKRAQLGILGIRLEHLKPFDAVRKASIRRRLGIPTGAILISFVGRTVYVKQPMVVLKAFVRVAKILRAEADGKKICLHLLIAGAGEAQNEIELESAAHSDIITLRPLVDHKEALEYIGASDIFCLPSLSEGISFATAEAMALGVATITTNIGGFPELVGKNSKAGMMFAPTGNEEGDIMEMIVRMERLIRNDGWRRGLQKRAERRVRRNFDATVAIPNLVTRITRTPLVHSSSKKSARKIMLKRCLGRYLARNGEGSDLKYIQRGLAAKKRDGYGAEYQKKCGEYGERWTKLIDALEEGSSCAGYTLDIKALRRSALSQCGHTTILNLELSANYTMMWRLSPDCGGFVPLVHREVTAS